MFRVVYEATRPDSEFPRVGNTYTIKAPCLSTAFEQYRQERVWHENRGYKVELTEVIRVDVCHISEYEDFLC